MTPHTEFQKKYYQQVIEIHQKTGFSPRKIAKLQLVPVSVRQMYHWIVCVYLAFKPVLVALLLSISQSGNYFLLESVARIHIPFQSILSHS